MKFDSMYTIVVNPEASYSTQIEGLELYLIPYRKIGEGIMSVDDLKWLVGLLSPEIALTVGLVNIIVNDKVKHPLRVAIPLLLLLAGISAYIAYLVVGTYWMSIVIILVTVFLFVIIFFVLKQRDIKGIKLGEHFIEFERIVDFQTSFVLDLVERNARSQIGPAVKQALKYILDVLTDYLGFDNNRQHKSSHDHSLSILFAMKNGHFEVLAQNGITPVQIQTIESKFKYKSKVVSVAGYAASKGLIVCIPDLSVTAETDDPVSYWISSGGDEKREGFMLCYPILRGVGENSPRPSAVICISSHLKEAYDREIVVQLLDRIVPKIENFLTIYRKFQ